MRRVLGLLFAIGILITSSATTNATSYIMTANGYVSSLDSGGSYSTNGDFAKNSPFSLTILFQNLSLLSPISNIGGDSTGVYGGILNYNVSIGSFTSSGIVNQFNLLIKNKHSDIPSSSGDSIGLVGFISGLKNNSPIIFSTPGTYESFNLTGYDTDRTTLSGAGLDQLINFSKFPNQNVEYDFVNSTFDNSVAANIKITSSSVFAVPEPATWGMMVLGLGLAGAIIRKRVRGVGPGRRWQNDVGSALWLLPARVTP